MSIRGIDSQMMIVRAPDAARDASEQLKKPEVSQDQQAMLAKFNETLEQKRVQHTSESEMETIRADKDGGGKGGRGGGGGHGEDQPDEDPSSGLLVAPGNHMIDIQA